MCQICEAETAMQCQGLVAQQIKLSTPELAGAFQQNHV
jgi:hypothetical protein